MHHQQRIAELALLRADAGLTFDDADLLHGRPDDHRRQRQQYPEDGPGSQSCLPRYFSVSVSTPSKFDGGGPWQISSSRAR